MTFVHNEDIVLGYVIKKVSFLVGVHDAIIIDLIFIELAVCSHNEVIAIGYLHLLKCCLLDAFIRFETFEFACRTIIGASTVGKPIYLGDEEILEFESQIPQNMPEFMDANHDTDEQSIRRNICKLVRRACRQGLMIGSYGTVSIAR